MLTTRAFSWAGKLRMALEPWVPPVSRPDESIASFIGRRFGAEAVTKVTGAPTLSRVYRWPHTIPQFDVGHLERMAAIEQCLVGVRGLFLSASGFRGTGLPDCIADARRTAGQVTHMPGAGAAAHHG